MKFEFIPIKTRVIQPPKDEIWDILKSLELRDGDIVFITSKILALHQGRTVKANTADKVQLVKDESTHFLPFVTRGGFKVNLTVTDNILIPNAGIDESNADGHLILWPKHGDRLCREIRDFLINEHNERKSDDPIQRLGVISTDSHTTPLRWGVTGIVTALSGVEPLKDLRGERDIFGREIVSVRVDIIDALAGMAVLLMGEAAEQTPIVILRGYNGIEFNPAADMSSFKIAPEDDLYQPLIEAMEKIKK